MSRSSLRRSHIPLPNGTWERFAVASTTTSASWLFGVPAAFSMNFRWYRNGKPFHELGL